MSNINYEADRLSEASLNGGALYVTALDSNDKPIGGYRPVGYCEGIEIEASDETIELKSSLTGPRSTAEKFMLERTLTTNITLKDVQPDNLALALAGTVEVASAEVGRVEIVKAYLGKPSPLDFSINETVNAPVVTDSTGLITYVEGKHYVLNKASVYPMVVQPVSDPIAEGSEIIVTYDANKSSVVQGFTKSGVNVGFYFEGFNQARGNSTYTAKLHKVSLDPTSSYALQSTDDFTTLTVTGTLLSNKAINGDGVSKFFTQTAEVVS